MAEVRNGEYACESLQLKLTLHVLVEHALCSYCYWVAESETKQLRQLGPLRNVKLRLRVRVRPKSKTKIKMKSGTIYFRLCVQYLAKCNAVCNVKPQNEKKNKWKTEKSKTQNPNPNPKSSNLLFCNFVGDCRRLSKRGKRGWWHAACCVCCCCCSLQHTLS